MKESGEAAYRLIIVERLSLIAVLLFGLVSLTTSKMAPTQVASARNANEEILAVAGTELSVAPVKDDIEVPVAGENEKEARREEARRLRKEAEEAAQAEEAARIEAEEAERAEEAARAEKAAQIKAQEEARAAAQARARAIAAEQARIAAEKARKTEEAAKKAAEQKIDYSKVIYVDDNGEAIDDGANSVNESSTEDTKSENN